MNQGNYKAYNVIQHMRYWEGQGVDPAFLFKDTGIDYHNIKETDWLDFESQVFTVWKNLITRVPDHESHWSIGYDSYKNRSMGAIDTIGRLASLEYIFKYFPELARRYSTVERFAAHRLNSTSVVMIYWPAPEFVSLHSLYQQSFLRGFLSAIPRIYEPSDKPGERSIPDANVSVELSCIELPTLFAMNYNHLIPGAHCEYIDDLFLVDKKPVARKISLGVERNTNGPQKRFFSDNKYSQIYCTKESNTLVNLPNQLGRKGLGYKVIDDFIVKDKKLLTRGEVYNAPYTRYNISWQKVPFLKRVRFFLSEKPKLIKNSREQLLAQLDVADQRYIAEIKARKRAEEKEQEARLIKEDLEKSEAQYRSVVENANDAIVIIQDTMIVFHNHRTETLTGYSSKELEMIPFIDFVFPDDQNMISEQYLKKMPEETSGFHYTFGIRHKNGSEVCVELNTVAILWKGKPAVQCFIRDVTQQKKMEEQLHQAQKLETLGTLAGGVAHDLNNILSGIVGYPDLILLQLPEDSPLRKPIIAIQDSGKKAAVIVQDLLTLARRGVANYEVVNINAVIFEYLESPEYEKLKSFHPNVNIETKLEAGLQNILGSPVHLLKVIMNLVSNSAEAIGKAGTISISTKNKHINKPLISYEAIETGDYISLIVTDTGTGISSEEITRIFEPFYTKKRMGKSGTGLGMAVVWGTVKDHKGYIDVLSKEDEGTTVSLYFPVTKQKRSKDKVDFPIEDYMGCGQSVLVVDDEKKQRELISAMLSTLGYCTTVAASGEEAVEYLRNNSFSLLILDMIMNPGMDGLDTYKKILQLHPGQKAIITSGFSDTNRVKEAQRLGAGKYIKKPYSLKKLGLGVKEELNK